MEPYDLHDLGAQPYQFGVETQRHLLCAHISCSPQRANCYFLGLFPTAAFFRGRFLIDLLIYSLQPLPFLKGCFNFYWALVKCCVSSTQFLASVGSNIKLFPRCFLPLLRGNTNSRVMLYVTNISKLLDFAGNTHI